MWKRFISHRSHIKIKFLMTDFTHNWYNLTNILLSLNIMDSLNFWANYRQNNVILWTVLIFELTIDRKTSVYKLTKLKLSFELTIVRKTSVYKLTKRKLSFELSIDRKKRTMGDYHPWSSALHTSPKFFNQSYLGQWFFYTSFS